MNRTTGEQRQPTLRADTRTAFTLIELLAVVVVISILLTLIIVVGSNVLDASSDARNAAQLRSIGQAIDAFETDFGYLPPLVPAFTPPSGTPITEGGIYTPGILADAVPGETENILRVNRYMSEYSLAAYLLGIGRFDAGETGLTPNETGINPGGHAGHDGVAGPGCKSPGRTRCWKDPGQLPATSIADLNEAHDVSASGRTYGPYIDIAALEDNLSYNEERQLYTINDDFGTPIRYYKDWPMIGEDAAGNPDPDRVSVERTPPELWNTPLIDSFIASNRNFDEVDPQDDPDLVNAEYILLAAGDDPEKFRDRNGDTIAPFGDVIIDRTTDQRLEININDATGDIEFPTGNEQALPQIADFIESNARYTG